MTKTIESSANPRIKNVKKILAGKIATDCIIEGKRLFKEAVNSGMEITQIFVTKNGFEDLIFKSSKDVATFIVPESLMSEISTVDTPPGIIAVAKRKMQSPIQLKSGFAAFAWSIRDPGNFGTIIRTAEASGCEFIACTNDNVDAYSPKVMRASMGSVFRIPIYTVEDPESYLSKQKSLGIRLCGLVPRNGENIFSKKLPERAMIILGGETTGIPESIDLDYKFSIPMLGAVESLNVGVAASVAFYQFMSSHMAKES
ncbi:MAG TPA: RNA methyltransferase [Acidobacteriota bacterium]|nr:RNA methyltransferase [Acidobacteriota bacterium]